MSCGAREQIHGTAREELERVATRRPSSRIPHPGWSRARVRATRRFNLSRPAFRRACAITISALMLSIGGLSVLTAPQPARAAAAPCSVQFRMYEASTPWGPTITAIRNLDTTVNRHPRIVHWYAQWGEPGSGGFAANQPWMLNAL